MSEQQQVSTSPVNEGAVPWWLLVCRWLWKLIGFMGTSIILALVVNIVSTWLTTSKGILPDDAPLHLFVVYWPITLLTGSCFLLLAALLWSISRWSLPKSEIPSLLITSLDRTRLVNRLHLRYEQMLSQSLQEVVRIELGFMSRPTAIHNAALIALRLPEQADQMLPAHTSIADVYEQAHHELLILGEPGSGKSTLLLELAYHLTEKAEQNAEQPVPVLLPLSSWANKCPPLQEWLIDQFTQLYTFPRALSAQWVQAGLVIPLLDGLDEMDKDSRPACIRAINAYHREHLHSLVVCSRTTEYDSATQHERLELHTAVVIQPLSQEQVDIHLAALGKPLAMLRTALKKNPTLADLASTPLMLQILTLTYSGITARQLSHKSVVLQQQIWTEYIQRMIERKGDIERYPLDRTITWLGWLAWYMHKHNETAFFFTPQSGYFFLGLPVQYRTLLDRIEKLCARVLGVSAGLCFGLFGALLGGLRFGLFGALLSGLCFGLPSAYLSVLLSVSYLIEKSGLGSSRDGEISGARIILSVCFGALTCGLLGVLFGVRFGGLLGVGFGVVFGLLGMVLGGLIIFFITMLIFLLIDLLLSPGEDIVAFYLFRFWIWHAHLFPWNGVPFLEDAVARTLLRRLGRGYSFTHRLLLEHFADISRTNVP